MRNLRGTALVLLMAISAGIVCPSAQAAVTAPDPSICVAQSEDPIEPGTTPYTPGAWYNPQRNKTGWQFLHIDGGPLVMYWFTFDRSGRPVWLQAAGQLDSTTNTYRADLLRYKWDWETDAETGGVLGASTVVGSIAVAFSDDPTQAAIRWEWNEASSFGVQTECIRDITRAGPSPQPLGANTAFTGGWSEPGRPGFGVFVNIVPQNATTPSEYVETATIALFDDAGEPVWFFADGGQSAQAPTTGELAEFPATYVVPQGYPNGVPVTACSSSTCGHHVESGSYERYFDTSSAMEVRVLADSTTYGVARFDRPFDGGTQRVSLTKLSAINLILVDRADCTVPVGESTCPITVNWTAESDTAKAYRVDLDTGMSTLLGSGSSGEHVDQLTGGMRVRYELRNAFGGVMFHTYEVRAFGSTPDPSELSLDRTQCFVHEGESTCEIRVTWSADVRAYPSATVFRRTSGSTSILQTSTSGSVADALRVGDQVVYELRASNSPTSQLLVESPAATAVAAGPSAVASDRTSCTVLQGQTGCSFTVTWSTDAQAYPGATLYRQVVGGALTRLRVATSGAIADAVSTGQTVTYRLYASDNVSARLLAESPAVTAVAAGASSVTVDPTQCTVLQGQSTCSVSVTWSTDAQAYPAATLFKQVNGGTPTSVQSATSGTLAQALQAGQNVVFQLRAENSAQSTLLGQSQTATAVSAGGSTVSVDRTQCIVLQGQTTCAVTVQWSTDAQAYPSATLFKQVNGGAAVSLRSATSGSINDDLRAGDAVVYQLRSGSSSSTQLLADSPQVTAVNAGTSSISVDPLQCTVEVGASDCPVSVSWSADAQAYPAASVYRLVDGGAPQLWVTTTSGSREDRLVAGTAVSYQLRAGVDPSTTLLASSAVASAVSAQPVDVTPPSAASCGSTDLGEFVAGTTPAFPGSWWNPERNRTGWALRFNDDGSLRIHWFTFSRDRRPVWLMTDDLTVNADNTVVGALKQYTWDFATNRRSASGTRVGSVAIAFTEDDPSKAAVRWQWDQAGAAPAADECIYDITRTGPVTVQSANSAYSGTWYEEALGRDASYDVHVAIVPVPNGKYVEVATLALFDNEGRPTWLNQHQTNPPGAPPQLGDSATFALEHYSASTGYPNGTPNNVCTGDCASMDLTGRYQRTFTSPATMQVSIDLSTHHEGGPIDGLGAFRRPSDNSLVTLVKASARNLILVDRVECTAPAGSPTCAIQVDWTADPQRYPNARAFRKDLVQDAVPELLPGGASGSHSDPLRPGARVQYQLRASSDPTSTVLFETMEVRTFGVEIQPSSINASPDPCRIIGGGTCTVSVQWSADPAAYPSATVFRTAGGRTDLLRTGSTGTLDDVFATETRVRYELRALPAPDSELLAQSAEISVEIAGEPTGPAATPPAPANPPYPGHDVAGDSIGATAAEFRVDESGQTTYRIPVHVPAGSGGFQPTVDLTYSSAGRDGPMGPGWSMGPVAAISRCRDSVEAGDRPRPASGDGFDVWKHFCLDGQRLVRSQSEDENGALAFRTEIDSLQKVLLTEGTEADPVAWRIDAKDGTVTHLGGANGTLIAEGKRLTWHTTRIEDRFHAGDSGIRFSYENDKLDVVAGRRLLSRIDYQGGYISFEYGNAASTDLRYVAGIALQTSAALNKIHVFATPPAGGQAQQVRRYDIAYGSPKYNRHRVRLASVTECGRSDATQGLVCRSPTVFDWADVCEASGNQPNEPTPSSTSEDACGCPPGDRTCQPLGRPALQRSTSTDTTKHFAELNSGKFGDVDGDGRADMIWHEEQDHSPDQLRVSFSSPAANSGIQFETSLAVHTFGVGFSDNRSWYLYDFNGDGRDDLLAASPAGSSGGRWVVKLSKVTPDSRSFPVFDIDAFAKDPGVGGAQITFDAAERSSALFADVNADGLPDLLTVEQEAGRGNNAKPQSKLVVRYMEKNSDAASELRFVFGDKRTIELKSELGGQCLDLAMGRHKPDSLDAFDINGDGWSELSLVGLTSTCPTQGANKGPQIYPDGVGETVSPASTDPVAVAGRQFPSNPQYWFVLRNDGPKGSKEHSFTVIRKIAAGAVKFDATDPRGVLQFVDINGDGVTDVATVLFAGENKDVWRYELGDGSGQAITAGGPSQCVLQTGDRCDSVSDAEKAFLADYDGDGRLDFWRASGPIYMVHLWTGDGFASTGISSGQLTKGATWQRFHADLDGDGYEDMLHVSGFTAKGDDDGGWTAARYKSHHQPRNVIDRITNGLGAVTDIDYAPMTASAVYKRYYDAPTLTWGRGSAVFDIRMPLWVVASAASSAPTTDDTDAMSSVLYRYEGMKVQAGGRGGLGFARVLTYDMQSGIEVTTQYEQAFPLTGRPKRTVSRRTAVWSNPCNGDFDASGCMTYVAPAAVDTTEPTTRLISTASSTFKWRRRSDLVESPRLAGPESVQVFLGSQAQSFFSAAAAENPATPSAAIRREVTQFESDTTDSGVNCPSGYDEHLNACKSVVSRTRGTNDILTPFESEKTETSRFDYGAADSIGRRFGRLLRSEVTHQRDAGSASESTTRVSTFEYDSTTLVLSAEHVQPDGGLAEALHTFYRRDAYGNVTKKAVCSNDPTTLTAPTAEGCLDRAIDINTYQPSNPLEVWRYARNEFDALGRYVTKTHSVMAPNGSVAETEMASTTYNLLGQAVATTDANGVTTTAVFGAFGQPRFEKVSSGGSVVISRARCGTAAGTVRCSGGASYRVHEARAGAPAKWTYFDRLDRPVLALQQGFASNEFIAVGTTYDEFGRVHTVSEPYFAQGPTASNPEQAIGSAPVYTTTTYDRIGRVVHVLRPDGTEIKTAYSGLTRTVTMPRNKNGQQQKRIERTNGLGELVYVRESNGQELTYEYTPTGEQKTVNGVATGQSVVAGIDDLGRKRSLSDPDMGDWQYVVNVLGETVAQAGPRGTCSAMDYDGQGRMWRRRDFEAATLNEATGECSGTLTHEAQWEYDASEVGKLDTEWTEENGQRRLQRTYAYDAYSRLSSVTTAYEGGAAQYLQRSTYDQHGRPFQQFFSVDGIGLGAQRVTLPETGELFEYNAQGYQHQTRNAFSGTTGRLYYRVDAMDARGQVTEESRHAGVEIRTERGYDLTTGRLKTIRTSGGVLQDLEYEYDNVGNIDWREDRSGLRYVRELFSYDVMQRLTDTAISVDGQVAHSAAVTYDPSGDLSSNIASKTGVGNYVYGGRASMCTEFGEVEAGPHAVIQAGALQLCYDAHGNMVRDSSGRRIDYTAFDLPNRMRHTGTGRKVVFGYGPGRERVLRTDSALFATVADEITHFVGAAEVHQYTAGGVIEVKRHLGPILLVQRHEAGETKLRRDYLFADALGSTHVVTDAGGVLKSTNGAMSFDPWGSRRDVYSASLLSSSVLAMFDTRDTTRHGFTGHEQVDAMGLIHMNGRIYDPLLGRFMQADPMVQAPNFGPSWNRYTYVFNNPLGYVDPSGYSAETWRTVLAVVITIWSGGVASGAISGTFLGFTGVQAAVVGGFLAGGIQAGSVKGAVFGAFSAAMFYGIGTASIGPSGKVLASGLAGGVMAEVQGGKFAHGFASSAFTAALSPKISGIKAGPATQVVAAAAVGGTASVLAGGKFSNGAATAAMSYAFALTRSPTSHMQPGGAYPDADPAKGAAAMAAADSALAEAGVSGTTYASELTLAKAWGKVVHPISATHGVEIGADIFGVDGGFRFGPSVSSGQPHQVEGLGQSSLPGGMLSATIHTHPSSTSFSGAEAGFSMAEQRVTYPRGARNFMGDLVSAYSSGTNAYVVLPRGRLDYWSYSQYNSIKGSDYFVPFGRATMTTGY